VALGNTGPASRKLEKVAYTMNDHQAVQDHIRQLVANNDVVLFMKGTLQFPQCGFSAQVGQIMQLVGVQPTEINVLEDMSIRDGIKEFSNWPTIPQLYVKGEFVGGCDIVREMYEQGELQDMLDQKAVARTKSAMV
jgi:monothiol glutaredoxin